VDALLEEAGDQSTVSRNNDEEYATQMIGKLAKLDLNPPQNRFFGKSR
jgi:hypothetical protein